MFMQSIIRPKVNMEKHYKCFSSRHTITYELKYIHIWWLCRLHYLISVSLSYSFLFFFFIYPAITFYTSVIYFRSFSRFLFLFKSNTFSLVFTSLCLFVCYFLSLRKTTEFLNRKRKCCYDFEPINNQDCKCICKKFSNLWRERY